MSYKIESNGQVLYERNSGEWVHYDMQYHLKVTTDGNVITATIYDYLDNKSNIDGAEISFVVDDAEFVIATIQGSAVIDAGLNFNYVEINSPNMRGCVIGKKVNGTDNSQARIEQLETENAKLWYETMLKDAKLSEHDSDIADLYYTIMTGGTGV